MNYRKGNLNDLAELKALSILTWSQFKNELEQEHWDDLMTTLQNDETYLNLLNNSESFICETYDKMIVGMGYLVPNGNPTDIYDEKWSYIRFLTVHPDFAGKGIGREITLQCMDLAKQNGEKFIALHTSEMMHSARHIYESLGFKILKEIPKRLGKRYWVYIYSI